MGFRVAVAGALLGAAQFAQGSPVYGNGNATAPAVVYTTEVVTALTTYCPAATTLTYNDKTYTITKATTLTITDCPCTISKPVKTTATASPPSDHCAQKCYSAYNICRGQPDANMAICAAKYAECLGYSPFGSDGSLITPTACSSQAITTKSATKPVVYTTEVVTAITTYCPEPTTLSFNNKTYTITKPTTLTITDCPCTIHKPSTVPSQPAEKDCAEKCYDAYNACRGQPDANMATCAAKYAECLGYSPFGSDGSLITPTACSSRAISTKPASVSIVYTTEVVTAITTYCPEPTTLSFNNKTYTVTEPTTLTITNCPCTIHKTSTIPSRPAVPTSNAPGKPTGVVPTSSGPNKPSVITSSTAQTTVPAKDCAAECYAAYNSCRGQSGANRSTCAAEFASCLGYNPFDDSGSLVTPTACSAGATGATAPPTVPSSAASTPAAVHTGAAGRLTPEHVLLALGAIALI